MAKFIMIVKGDDNKVHTGLNEINSNNPIEPFSSDTFTFTDTNWLSHRIADTDPSYLVYDVEVPHGETFIANTTFYVTRKVILSNPRELRTIDNTSNRFDINNASSYTRYYIADKDSNHKLIKCE